MTNALARRSDPLTSHIAAKSVNASQLQKTVLHYLRLYGAMTTREIAAKSGIDWGSISPRMKPLEASGLVERRGTKTTTYDSGRKRKLTVWASR